jgi:chemotaxis protein MotA
VEFLAYKTRRYGSKSLEEDLKKIDNAFLRKGMELVMDGYDRYDIRNIMEQEFEVYLAGRESQTNILGTMSKLAPVFGFAGTIIGLINILSNIGEPSQIGQGMAVALLTTFYGLMFGNLLFMPLSKKLNETTRNEAAVFYILLDGITDITEEKNSKAIAHKMRSSLALHNLIPATAAKPAVQKQKIEEKYTGRVTRKMVFQEGVCLKN